MYPPPSAHPATTRTPFLARAPPDPASFATDPRVFFMDTSACYRDDDGVVWEWQPETRTWFPVVPEATRIAQQEVYASSDTRSTEDEPMLSLNMKRKLERKKFLEAHKKPKPAPKNTSIFLSNLPPDTTVETLATLCARYGLLAPDREGRPRVKLYCDAEGRGKGEALVTYLKDASVDLAVQFLDETEIDGHTVRVTRAQFAESARRSRTPSDAAVQERGARGSAGAGAPNVHFALLERKLGWSGTEDVRHVGPKPLPLSYQKMVVLKHMFTADELAADPTLRLDIKAEIREECDKLGIVTNVVLCENEPEGIVLVRFKDPRSATACIKMMHGRYYAGRSIEAALYDGTKYRNSSGAAGATDTGGAPAASAGADSDEARLQQFEAWLENHDDGTPPA